MLDAEREYTNQIPWSKIVAYCDYYGFTDEQTEWALAIIQAVDVNILEKRRREVKRGNT